MFPALCLYVISLISLRRVGGWTYPQLVLLCSYDNRPSETAATTTPPKTGPMIASAYGPEFTVLGSYRRLWSSDWGGIAAKTRFQMD